ncbi:hypothetical protein O7626_41055 [Micromonospora sp. WMMD1102]|uniref:hypothetical protein n=1 Tax=Micromonospora sp. WMMD1102 TaxID=3016105 RepID=UPI0024152550|nr:hypothetical protein [Micromonospora sp. WMMD1102]MDG4784376.1 hypothetical protein [Micromonospora sp. WMMD1102]MDG4792194.1 hypothetical protein [Micromonospora sp. WMMD1102]
MKTTQYVRQERAISAADSGGIRERWLWGLRLLRDPEAMSSEKSLRHGVADQLIAAAGKDARGRNRLGEQEIQRRLRCARAYKTEAEIRAALTDFGTWDELARAGFPAYEAPEGEPPADHRTEAERERDAARALLDLIGEQGALFPASDFEPTTTPLKDLKAYADEMEELTGRFVERDRKRRAYLDSLIAAVDGDLGATWQEAQERLDSKAAA